MRKKTLLLECQKQIQRIKLKDICYLHYQDGIISFYMVDNRRLLHCNTLKGLENKLTNNFVRISRNIIINLNYLSAYFKSSHKVTLVTGKEFTVSRRNVAHFTSTLTLDR
ncbi:MAG: LytTR family transcriptional regulator [Carboxylicivirga sp.]|nr:LytTR family transcriptional regulator [Carboxylicivirga sp.]